MTFVFDPKDVNILFGGVRITGFADGTFVKIDYNADNYTLQMGSDGLGARSKSNDKSAKITITLMPNSPANKVLGGAMMADQASNTGAFALVIDDLSSGDKFAAVSAWVMKDPGREFAKEISTKEWVLETDYLAATHGAAL